MGKSIRRKWIDIDSNVLSSLAIILLLMRELNCFEFNVKRLSLLATQKEDQKLVFKTDYRLMQVKSIAECSLGYSASAFSDNQSSNQFLVFFLSEHFGLCFEWPLKTYFTVCTLMCGCLCVSSSQ